MTSRIRTVAVHDVVQRTYPRPPPGDRDLVALAAGRAIDGTLSQFGYEFRQGRRPTATAMRRVGESLLEEDLDAAGVDVPPAEKEKILTQLLAVLAAYRRSEIVGLPRPKSRVLVIDGAVGVYAQPDYWDGRTRFYEMKSYPAIPPPPDVALQVRLFQLAFPGLTAVLLCLNRHVVPVAVTSAVVPPPSPEEGVDALRRAYDVGREFGEEKVLEYVEGPFVHYALPRDPRGGGPATGPA
jgi:hypothetical protein